MKTYIGHPGTPPTVIVRADGVDTPLAPFPGDERAFDWDDLANRGQGSAALAKAILFDVMGDEIRATEFHMRFKHRIVVNWKKTNPWSLPEAEVRKTIEDIQAAAAAMRPAVQQASLAAAPVANEGGVGPSGSRIEWDKKELPDEAERGAKNTNQAGTDRSG